MSNPRTARNTLRCSLLAACVVALCSSPASAQRRGKRARKAKPACGIHYLPLVEGNEWVYEPMDPPEATPGQAPAPTGRKRWTTVKPPDKVTIRVTKIEAAPGKGAKGKIVTLEEITGKDTRSVQLSCSAAGLIVSPQSFFFAGSPGGGYLMTLKNITRTGTTYPGKKVGLRASSTWSEAVTADVDRGVSKGSKVTHAPAKMTVERTVLVEGTQPVSVSGGNFKKATRVRIDLSGRATIEQPKKRVVEIPAGQIGVVWFANKVGVVQTRDSVGRWFQLTSSTLK